MDGLDGDTSPGDPGFIYDPLDRGDIEERKSEYYADMKESIEIFMKSAWAGVARIISTTLGFLPLAETPSTDISARKRKRSVSFGELSTSEKRKRLNEGIKVKADSDQACIALLKSSLLMTDDEVDYFFFNKPTVRLYFVQF